MSFCIVDGTNPNKILPFNENKDKTVQVILQDCELNDLCLAYKNTYYTEVLHLNDKPLELHPDLCIDEKLEDYPPPEICLKTIPLTDKKQIWIEVQVTTQLKDVLPLMSVPFNTKEIQQMTAQDIILSCKSTFGYEFSDEKLEIDGKEIPLDAPAKDIIEKSKTQRLYLRITIGDQGRKKISARGHVTAEIISSEASYSNDLQMIEDYWEPKFKASKCFEEKEVHSLFRDIRAIHQVHKNLLADLQKIKPGFDAEMSFTFIKHLDNFVKATAFVSAFKALDDMMKKKRSNRSVDKTLTEIEQNMPLQNGRNFMSYYITPVQRYPRYPLLFRELDKCTPAFHPEKPYIQYTFHKLTEVNKKIDAISHRVLNMKLMDEIQQKMPEDQLIISHGREIIEQANVRIVSKRTGPGIIYLFNDIIMPCFAKKKTHTPIEQVPILEFHFANGKPSKNFIFFEYNNEPYQLDFQDMSDKQTWMEAYRNVLEEQFKDLTKQNLPYVKWFDAEPPGVGERVMHDGCLTAGHAYFFGGTNESTQPTSKMFRYHDAESSWEVEDTPVPPREGHTVASIRGNLYVCFGLNMRERRVYNDIWQYSSQTKQWVQCKPESQQPIPPRFGHTCVVYDNKLYFFGGKVRVQDRETTTNTISCYDPHTNKYEEIPTPSEAPSPRSQHAAVLVNKTEMAVIGGRSDKMLSDVWVYDFQDRKWSPRAKAVVHQRADHKAVVLANRYIFVVGGLLEQNRPETVVIDSKSWTTIDFKQFGNVPPNLSKHAIVGLDNNRFIICGGFNRITRRSFPSAWILDISDSVSKFVNASPVEPDEYWKRDTPQNPVRLPPKRSATVSEKTQEPPVILPVPAAKASEEPVPPPRTGGHAGFSTQQPPSAPKAESKEPIPLGEQKSSSGLFSFKKKKPVIAPPQSNPVGGPPPSQQVIQKPVQLRPVERRHSELPDPHAGVFSSDEITNTRANLRRKTINAPLTKQPSEEQLLTDRMNWRASGRKFDMDVMCKELGIQLGEENQMKLTFIRRNCLKLWQKNMDNNELEDKCKKMENFISGNFEPPPGTSFLLKIFDDDSRCSNIIRIDTSVTCDYVVKKVCDILNKSEPILSIMVGKGEQKALDEKSLHDAICCVYKGDMRCLTINAL